MNHSVTNEKLAKILLSSNDSLFFFRGFRAFRGLKIFFSHFCSFFKIKTKVFFRATVNKINSTTIVLLLTSDVDKVYVTARISFGKTAFG
jgi:hypothetical protein